MSAVSDSDQMSYELADESAFQTYGLEYAPSYGKNSDGYITWTQVSPTNSIRYAVARLGKADTSLAVKDDKTTFHLHETALSGDKDMDIGQRLVSREPMQIIMNLAISETWSESENYTVIWKHPVNVIINISHPTVDSEKLVFPATLRFDWVRVVSAYRSHMR